VLRQEEIQPRVGIAGLGSGRPRARGSPRASAAADPTGRRCLRAGHCEGPRRPTVTLMDPPRRMLPPAPRRGQTREASAPRCDGSRRGMASRRPRR
jgi:hypothetical protein